jgi:hypothetical protein
MPSTNGHGRRHAVLCTCVWTDERVHPRYFLAQQVGADLYRATPGAWLRPRD